MYKKLKGLTLSFHHSIPHHSKRGFTLIELLVVMFIIAILATMVIINVSSSRVSARDARRKADLKSIQTAIEMFNNKTGSYPKPTQRVLSCWVNNATQNWIPNGSYDELGSPAPQYLWSTPYISGIQPRDPIDRCCYPTGENAPQGCTTTGPYEYWSDGNNYRLLALLENHDDPDRQEKKQVRSPSTATTWYGNDLLMPMGKYIYVLAN